MALRIATKINRQFVKNLCRSLSIKRDVPDLEVTPRAEDATGGAAGAPGPQSQLPPSSAAYQVCQPRINKSASALAVAGLHQRSAVQNESDVARNAMAMQHLQPALLPEFFKPPVEINSSIYQEPANEAEKQSSIKKARRFEESSTRLSLTLPLKAPKLANPFPDPVKVMESHTVSDREKAEQMLAEQKMASRTALPSMAPPEPAARRRLQAAAAAGGQRRFYSTNSGSGKRKDCKLPATDMGAPGRKKLRRFRMAYCSPMWTGGCVKLASTATCKKKLAPYPSYSELCVTEPYRKPSECRTCPWKLHEHPTFHPLRKRFHTGSKNVARVGGKQRFSRGNLQSAGKFDGSTSAEETVPRPGGSSYKPTVAAVECLEKKPPCTRPPSHCQDEPPQDAAEKEKMARWEKGQKSSGGGGGGKERKNTKKTANGSLSEQIEAWLHQVARKKTPLMEAAEAQKVLSGWAARAMPRCQTVTDGALFKDDTTCKKFPFKEDSFPLVKYRKPKPRQLKPGECPKKPSPKLIKDCPPEPKDDRCAAEVGQGPAVPPGGSGVGYLMANSRGTPKKPEDCVKFPAPKCKEEEKDEIQKDRCGGGLKPRSAYCPEDVGKELGYTTPKFVPKTQKEMDKEREDRSKKSKSAGSVPFVPPPLLNPATLQITWP